MKIEPWDIVKSETENDCRIFRVLRRFQKSPSTGETHDFFVLDCPDWVNILALTKNNDVIVIEQYRHGTDNVTLEIPGGQVDKEDSSPEEAAKRELREETGYESDQWTYLGFVHPNPAIQNNRCHLYLAEGSCLTKEQNLDPHEEIAFKSVPLTAFHQLIQEGKITHSLVLNAFFLFKSLKRQT